MGYDSLAPHSNVRTGVMGNLNTEMDYSTERSPLLVRAQLQSTDANSCKILSLAVIFIVGTAIGIYLLLEDVRKWPVNHPFELVERNYWAPDWHIDSGAILKENQVSIIIFMHTKGEACYNYHTCIRIVRDMKKKANETHNHEIPYQFLIGGDGKTYEGRGWTHASGFPFKFNNNTLTIGFIGDFSNYSPTDVQIDEAKALISESVRRRKLSSNYEIYGARIDESDGEKLFEIISEWDRFESIFKKP